MNPIYEVGEHVVFAIARDIDVIILEKREIAHCFYDYHVSWFHDGDRREAWVSACELDRKTGREVGPCR